ncbi:hypothetical protein PO587_38650 [Streptomyces gilvifuscus]|uniref:Uncharacterized protein n=1 Tax=Streptomyces gilvifuscus TaxID=1550617 RepID=A0ABT5G6I9_9ACTN|nr:hypothetical protein [Streptomyces gilvifuscus]MDC2960363.1 hypothetical protein [Streptomyces gilvifuscus]
MSCSEAAGARAPETASDAAQTAATSPHEPPTGLLDALALSAPAANQPGRQDLTTLDSRQAVLQCSVQTPRGGPSPAVA